MATEEDVDATRRTRLANERTYLAWWRGGLTSLAVAFGIGALLPKVSDDTDRWPFAVLGVGFALLAVAFIWYGLHRFRTVERALDRGEFAQLDMRAAMLFAAFGAVLAALTIVAVVLEA